MKIAAAPVDAQISCANKNLCEPIVAVCCLSSKPQRVDYVGIELVGRAG